MRPSREMRRKVDRLVQWLAERIVKTEEGENVIDELSLPPLYCPTSVVICSNTATFIAWKLGGKMVGYDYEDNNTAKLGEDEGGHDFALINGRYIVDFWANAVSGDPYFYDLKNPKDYRKARVMYGHPGKWELVNDFSEGVSEERQFRE